LVELGAKAAESPKELAEGADHVEIVVVDDAQVEEVSLGGRGLFAGSRPQSIIAIHSTIVASRSRFSRALVATDHGHRKVVV
jgi:3-hydroxyisobutyrate dehydrogenase